MKPIAIATIEGKRTTTAPETATIPETRTTRTPKLESDGDRLKGAEGGRHVLADEGSVRMAETGDRLNKRVAGQKWRNEGTISSQIAHLNKDANRGQRKYLIMAIHSREYYTKCILLTIPTI